MTYLFSFFNIFQPNAEPMHSSRSFQPVYSGVAPRRSFVRERIVRNHRVDISHFIAVPETPDTKRSKLEMTGAPSHPRLQ